MKFITIGVYGFKENEFFEALRRSGVDTFCDIRWRRGVRGAEYAYANRARLERRLTDLGIRYLHFPELAPTPALRQRQYQADEAAGIAKRRRSTLSEAFVSGYRQERLAAFDSREFVERLGTAAKIVALFCVEGEPSACHRWLLAERLQQDLGIGVGHLKPETA